MMSTCTHKGLYSTTKPVQMCTESECHTRSPLPNWSFPLAPFHHLWLNKVGKRYSRRTDQSTLVNGGCEHAKLFSVDICKLGVTT